MDKKVFNKTIRLIFGAVLLIVGVALILAWWDALVIVSKGVLGVLLALAGLFIMYSLKV